MAAQSTLKNMLLCLTLVCLLCAAILGGVYAMTYNPIQKTNEAILKASIGAVLPEGGDISEEKTVVYDGRTYTYYEQLDGDEVKAYAVKSATAGFGGRLELMVGVLPDGTVNNAKVVSHSETPGLGAKCQTDAQFIDQFKGLGPGKVIKLRKDGGDVDAITASTITSRAYTLAVSNAVEAVKSLKKEN